jgi:hypothetical protein
MGLVFRKTKRLGRRSWLNLSRSGASVSHRRGPLTLNSRGRGSVRIAPGLSFRFKLFK